MPDLSAVAQSDPSWKETFVRAIKTAVAQTISTVGIALTPWFNISTVRAALLVAGGAGITIILNRVLLWANSP